MSEDSSECSCVVDCAGLHEIAMTTSNNLKTLYLDQLSAGVIGVPAYVWQEFEEIYPDDAASLESYITLKIKMKKAYHVGAASIAYGVNRIRAVLINLLALLGIKGYQKPC